MERLMLSLRAHLTLLSALALVCLPAVAQASEKASFNVSFSPSRLGAPTTLEMDVTIVNTQAGLLPSPTTGFNMHLPLELELLGSTLGLAICQPAPLLADGLTGCSPNARLGSGIATVEVPFGPEIVTETATIEALMGPPVGEQIGVLLYVEGKTPVAAQLVFPGQVLLGQGENGGQSLETSITPTPTLPGAPDAAVTHLHLSVGPKHLTYYKKVHGRMVGFRPTGIALPRRCPRGGFRFVTEMGFQDGTSLTLPSTVSCSMLRRH
jgi:hypothetical protein